MHPLSIILVLLVGVPLLVICVPAMLSDARRERGVRRVLMTLAAAFVAIGVVGFFGSALSAVGGLNWLKPSFEWPVGYVSGVVTTPAGIHIVPHTPSGRVQLYDSEWRFIKGWHVDAGGGTFKVLPVNEETVEVVTARGQQQYAFDLGGRLLSSGSYSPSSYSDFADGPEAWFVPTAPWLLVFSHPWISWATAASGIVLLILLNKTAQRRRAAKRAC